MALRTRRDVFKADTRVVSQRLAPTSRLVSKVTGLKVPRNKAIVGQNAFAHESGVHQDGVLKERTTYEIMSAESVGFAKNDLVLGKHSGRAALAARIKSLGYELEREQLDAAFEAFKRLADLKKDVFDADIIAIVDRQISPNASSDAAGDWEVVSYSLGCASGSESTFEVVLSQGGVEKKATATQENGPIDAMFAAVREIVGLPLALNDFKIEAVSGGSDAQGEVVVFLNDDASKSTVRGQATSTDVFEATLRALVSAVNRVQASRVG